MKAQRCLDGTNSSGEWPETKQALQVTIAYKDLAAGKRAMHTLAQLGRGLVDDIEFQPFPWSFDLLMDANWRDIAFRHAVQADILILATSDSAPVPTGVTQWMEAILDRKQGTDCAVVALFGTELQPEPDDSSRIQTIRVASQKAGLPFFAPVRRELGEALFHLQDRAERVTPLLDDVLRTHPPTHWGLNE
jgi:hypothetical protein